MHELIWGSGLESDSYQPNPPGSRRKHTATCGHGPGAGPFIVRRLRQRPDLRRQAAPAALDVARASPSPAWPISPDGRPGWAAGDQHEPQQCGRVSRWRGSPRHPLLTSSVAALPRSRPPLSTYQRRLAGMVGLVRVAVAIVRLLRLP